MKFKIIGTLLICFSLVSCNSFQVNCVGIDDSINKELLLSEIQLNEEKEKLLHIKEEKEKELKQLTKEVEELSSEVLLKEEQLQEQKAKVNNLGTFEITAYCSCEKCCDSFANNRPHDKNGKEIVVGSIGCELIQGVSIAVDPSIIPYGTKVSINDHEYVAHDTGGAIKGNKIDVYFSNHEDAVAFGVQYAEVIICEY